MGCWKRCACELSNMTSPYNDGFTVFSKDGGATSQCPEPCMKNQTFEDECLESLNQTSQDTYLVSLIWEDDFQGSQLNASNWDVREDGVVFNGELQMYKRGENAQVRHGALRITGKCESYKGQDFTSAKLHSRFRFRAGHR